MPLEEVRKLFKFRKYATMLKNGLPEGAIRQKMTMNGEKILDIDIFFGDAPMPSEAAIVPIAGVHKEDGLSDAAREAAMLAGGGNAGMAKFGIGNTGAGGLFAAIESGVQLKPVRQRHTQNVQKAAQNNLLAELKSTNRVSNYGLKGRSDFEKHHDHRAKIKRKTSSKINQNTGFGAHILRKTSTRDGGHHVDTGAIHSDDATKKVTAQELNFGAHMLKKTGKGVGVSTHEATVSAGDLKFGGAKLRKTGAGQGALWATLV